MQVGASYAPSCFGMDGSSPCLASWWVLYSPFRAHPSWGELVDSHGYDYLPDAQVDTIAASLLGMTGLTIAEVVLSRVKALGSKPCKPPAGRQKPPLDKSGGGFKFPFKFSSSAWSSHFQRSA